ncbi:MAG: hypothetical protein D6722_14685 [Bacteroidetes bacterium]|nr:MAG: hypothetical protein D6722_14685 [Bacteroidota bacterium]
MLVGGFQPPQRPPQGQDVLVDVRDLSLRKDHPSIFTFQLKRGDSLFAHCPPCLDLELLERNRMEATLSSADGSDIIRLGSSHLRRGFQVRLDGTYKLELATRSNFLNLDTLRILRSPRVFPPDSGTTVLDVLHVYIGDEDGKDRGNPKYAFSLLAEDSLTIQMRAGSDKADIFANFLVEVRPEGQSAGATYSPDGSGTLRIGIAEARRFELAFTLQKKNFWDLSKDFFDIKIVRSTAHDRAPAQPERVGPGGTNTGPEPEPPSEEEDLAAVIAALLPQPVPGLQGLGGNEIRVNVAGREEYTRSNCDCQPLDLEAADAMVYWMGTGPGAKEEYYQIQSFWAQRSREGELFLLGMYARSILIDQQPNDRLFRRPDGPADLFQESIEMAIVDAAGREVFERGGTVASDWGQSVRAGQYHNFQPAVYPGEWYVCFRNHNRWTPVDVTFMYELYNKQAPQAAGDEPLAD